MKKYNEQDHPREIIKLQSRQQKEFNNKIEAEQEHITEEVNQLHFAITSTKNNLDIDTLEKELKNTLEIDLKKFKDKVKLSTGKEQKRL